MLNQSVIVRVAVLMLTPLLAHCAGLAPAAAEITNHVFAPAAGRSYLPFHDSVSIAVVQAHARIWQERVDPNGVIYDYVGDIPTPEECSLGKPNAIGW